ncbi:MAG: transcriptional regulator [Paenibacillaceae bacterium]|nr:transcriptional regulator [Paenibacillaceae bacterium]
MNDKDMDKDKERIIAAALEMMRTEGIKSVSVSNIAARCHISKSTFYKHFSSKEDLIGAMRRQSDNLDGFHSVREHIVLKAHEHFASQTFDAIDMDSIARSAGLKRTAIYGYFSGKEELLELSLQRELNNRMQLRTALEEIPFDRAAHMERMIEYAVHFSSKADNNMMFHNALYLAQDNIRIKALLHELWGYSQTLLELYFERGIAEGIFRRETDARQLSQMVFSYCVGVGVVYPGRYMELGKRFMETLFGEICQA